MEILTNNPNQTKKTGFLFAKEVLKESLAKNSIVLGLKGDLGSVKTTFLQGFDKGLGIKDKILSPTFIVMKRFKIKKPGFESFYHVDCYRTQGKKDLLSLGLKEIVSRPGNVVAVEWADKIKKALPPKTVFINIYFIEENKRRIVFNYE